MKEKAVLFGKFNTLVGVVTEPEAPANPALPAVVLTNTGLMHRVGPNRLYVKLARRLADLGYTVLRFDLSGLGDSAPRPDATPIEEYTIEDVHQAMDYLQSSQGSQQFILAGHCAGGFHSFRAAIDEPRVSALVMINPDFVEPDWQEFDRKRKLISNAQNYYVNKSLRDTNLWKRILRFQINYRAVLRNIVQNYLLGNLSVFWFRLHRKFSKPEESAADELFFTVESVLKKMPEMQPPALITFAENSTALERVRGSMGREIKELVAAGKLDVEVIPGADHIYTPLAAQERLFAVVTSWVTAQQRQKTA